MLQRKIQISKDSLTALLESENDIVKRSEELEASMEEATNEEEMAVVEQEVEKLEEERNSLLEKKSKLEGEIAALESELEQFNSKEPVITNKNNEGVGNMNRNEVLEYLQRDEVRDFYAKVREAVLNKRALTGADLVIPEAVLNRIQPLIGDYSNLYNEVDKVTLNGTARVIVDGAKPEAIWVEMCDPVQELAAAFDAVELDGYKVGGFIPVCNAILEDSMIDLANYLERSIAEAIAKALDKAILIGTGSVGKQPEGIIPAIPVLHQVAGETLAEILPHLGLVDTGESEIGEVIAVMNRKTYYNRILPQTIATTSDGRQVVQGVTNPNIAGLRVVFSNYAPDDNIILGDFKKYLLGERKGVTLASSTDVRFIEDQTVFKGIARYDGKPVNENAFVLVDVTPVVQG